MDAENKSTTLSRSQSSEMVKAAYIRSIKDKDRIISDLTKSCDKLVEVLEYYKEEFDSEIDTISPPIDGRYKIIYRGAATEALAEYRKTEDE